MIIVDAAGPLVSIDTAQSDRHLKQESIDESVPKQCQDTDPLACKDRTAERAQAQPFAAKSSGIPRVQD